MSDFPHRWKLAALLTVIVLLGFVIRRQFAPHDITGFIPAGGLHERPIDDSRLFPELPAIDLVQHETFPLEFDLGTVQAGNPFALSVRVLHPHPKVTNCAIDLYTTRLNRRSRNQAWICAGNSRVPYSGNGLDGIVPFRVELLAPREPGTYRYEIRVRHITVDPELLALSYCRMRSENSAASVTMSGFRRSFHCAVRWWFSLPPLLTPEFCVERAKLVARQEPQPGVETTTVWDKSFCRR